MNYAGLTLILGHAEPWARYINLALGLILVVAGMAKIFRLPDFRQGLSELNLIKPAIVPVTALAIPAIELLIGISLITGREANQASGAAAAMFLTFAIVISLVLVTRSYGSTCRCFGLKQALNWAAVVRNVGLAILSLSTLLTSTAPVVALVGGALMLLSVIPWRRSGMLWHRERHAVGLAAAAQRQ